MPTVLTRHDSYERDLTPAAGIVCGTTRADEAPVKRRWSFNQRRSRGDGSDRILRHTALGICALAHFP